MGKSEQGNWVVYTDGTKNKMKYFPSLYVQRLHGWKLPILLTQVSYPKTAMTFTFDVVESIWKEEEKSQK